MLKKGFTIIEMLVVIFFLSLGVTGALIAIQQTMAWSETSSQRLTAIYLVQEGIEIVRNIRDTNWLQATVPGKSSPWDDGICTSPPCTWQADYTTMTFEDTTDFERCSDLGYYNCHTYDDTTFLRIDGGFYNYSSGTITSFKRKITISDKTVDQMKVTVAVYWEAKGSHQISAQEILYNWRQ